MKVFISHSSIDKPFVLKLKKDLGLNYIDTWLDQDEMFPGDNLIDKLSEGLQSSTHFVIVLSENSVKSDWVKLELNTVLEKLNEQTKDNLIPILYRPCKIPKEIGQLIYLDLSQDTVFYRKEILEFFGDNYQKELDKLVRSIKRGEKELSREDKNEILGKKSLITSNQKEIINHLQVVGYNSISSFLANQISDENQKKININQNNLLPIVLPKTLEPYMNNISFWDFITFENKDGKKIEGNFARYGKYNNRIVIPEGIREFLGIKNKGNYKIIYNPTKRIFKAEEINEN